MRWILLAVLPLVSVSQLSFGDNYNVNYAPQYNVNYVQPVYAPQYNAQFNQPAYRPQFNQPNSWNNNRPNHWNGNRPFNQQGQFFPQNQTIFNNQNMVNQNLYIGGNRPLQYGPQQYQNRPHWQQQQFGRPNQYNFQHFNGGGWRGR